MYIIQADEFTVKKKTSRNEWMVGIKIGGIVSLHKNQQLTGLFPAASLPEENAWPSRKETPASRMRMLISCWKTAPQLL